MADLPYRTELAPTLTGRAVGAGPRLKPLADEMRGFLAE
jgi:hypothetical protein